MLAGGTWVDVAIGEAHDPLSRHPFKGDIDLRALRAVLRNPPGPVVFVR